MAKKAKKRFSFQESDDLQLESQSKEVSTLQALLAAFGHLRGSYRPGTFCKCTERAVRRYQRFYGLKSDGIVGKYTKGHMEQPRCGVPDFPVSPGGVATGAPFLLRGCKYERHDLTYAFINGTNDLAGQRERDIVSQAFGVWANVANVSFQEVSPGDSPDFRIAWQSGDHGDGSSFDGPGNTLAHAFFPPPCGGPNAGDLHFDEHEAWIEDPSASGIVLLNVAIHEVGHLLGLSHSQEEEAIMFAFYSPDRAALAHDDIEGIRALYGERSESRQLLLTSVDQGQLARTSDTANYEVSVPETLAVSIDGPADADFDLYVKKDAPPTVDTWDFRAFTVSSDERIVFPAEPGATYHILVQSYAGEGSYTLKVEPGAQAGA